MHTYTRSTVAVDRTRRSSGNCCLPSRDTTKPRSAITACHPAPVHEHPTPPGTRPPRHQPGTSPDAHTAKPQPPPRHQQPGPQPPAPGRGVEPPQPPTGPGRQPHAGVTGQPPHPGNKLRPQPQRDHRAEPDPDHLAPYLRSLSHGHHPRYHGPPRPRPATFRPSPAPLTQTVSRGRLEPAAASAPVHPASRPRHRGQQIFFTRQTPSARVSSTPERRVDRSGEQRKDHDARVVGLDEPSRAMGTATQRSR